MTTLHLDQAIERLLTTLPFGHAPDEDDPPPRPGGTSMRLRFDPSWSDREG